MFALVTTLLLLGLVALVGDSQFLYVNYDRLDGAALLGAQAGASDVDIAQLTRTGVLQLADDATVRCERTANQIQRQVPQATAHCAIDNGHTVQAHIQAQVTLPIPLGASPTISATRSSRLTYGGSTGGFN